MSSQGSLRDLVWNAEERRPRLPARLFLVSVLFVVATALVGAMSSTVAAVLAAVPIAVTLPSSPGDGGAIVETLPVFGGAVATVASVWLAGRVLDRRRFVDFGLRVDRDWWIDFGFGLLLGAGLMTGIVLVGAAMGWIAVTDVSVVSVLPWLVGGLVLFGTIGIYEELLVRGYVLTNFAEGARGLDGVDRRVAVALATLLSAAVFGLAHASNPSATAVSVLALTLGGIVLAVGYVLTGDLAIPIGLHITWNLFQGTVYGFPVSGLDLGESVVSIEVRGPDLVTGGAFGPEAGLLGIGALAVGSGLIVAWVRWRYGRVAIADRIVTPDLRWR